MLAVVLGGGLSGALVGTAAAHATFPDAATLALDADVPLTVHVPHERGPSSYNVSIVVAVPAGWRSVSCAAPATWACAIAESEGASTITYTKAEGAERGEDESFSFTLHTPVSAGTFSVPTRQVYRDGTTMDWTGAPGTAQPAPELFVGDAGAAAPPPPVQQDHGDQQPTVEETAPPPVAEAPPPTPVATAAPAAAEPIAVPASASEPAAVPAPDGGSGAWPARAGVAALVVAGIATPVAIYRSRQAR